MAEAGRSGVEALERRLIEAEHRLQATLSSIGEGVVTTDAEGLVTFLNPAAERMTGWPLADAEGLDIAEVLPLVDAATGRQLEHPAARALLTTEIEQPTAPVLLVRRDGARIPAEVSAGPVVPRAAPETAVGATVTFRDISEISRMADALRESESRYRAVVEDQAEFIVRWLPDGTRTFVNEAYARYFGSTPEELTGVSFFPLIPSEEEREAVVRNLEALTPESPIMMDVHRARRADGELRWQEWVDRALFDSEGRLVELQSVGRDVHERVIAEEALRESEARFHAIFDQTFQFAGLLRPDGTLIEANRTALQFQQVELSEVLGQPFWETPWWSHSAEEQERLRDAIRRAAGGEFVRSEVTHRGPDGTLHWIDFSLKPVHDEHGEITLLIPEGRDITEQKRLEEQLRQSQKMQAIGQLAGGVAHDFNNLLTVISGYGDLLSLELEDAPDHLREAVRAIRDAGDRAALLTRQLLAFSRNQVLEPRVLNLNDLVHRSETMLRRLIEEDVTQLTELEPRLHPLRVDPGQLEQVILNLCLNARDAMAGGGRLTIGTSNLELDEESCQEYPGLRPGPHVVLTVSDTGHGMSEEVRTRVFEPFFTTKDQGRGTGLGLSTVYGIVEQSGGHVAVESALGVGSTFTVLLPACVGEPACVDGSEHHARTLHGNETILLVEDEPAVRRVGCTTLTMHGYTVLEAASGTEALEVAGSHSGPLDLVVTDLVMPGMSGWDLAQEVRAARPGVRVMFVSGYAQDAALRRGIAESREGFLSKPFTPLQLARKVREVLSRSAGP